MKIALFGGTFDPIHNGHLAVAKEAVGRFHLDQILFIPSGQPPHKNHGPQATYEDRFRMVELACRCDRRFEASRLEDPAVLGDGKTYSIDAIEKARQNADSEDSLYFLIGRDAFDELSIWHRLEDVVRQIEFIVATRPSTDSPAEPEGVAALARYHQLDGIEIPTSATQLRAQMARGENIDVSLPPEVGDYIRHHRLYR